MTIVRRFVCLPLLIVALAPWHRAPEVTGESYARQRVGQGAATLATLATLVRAEPASGALVRRPPHTVDLVFAGPIDARHSTLLVVSDAMTLVNGAVTVAGPRRDELRSPLQKLAPGPYVVIWTAGAPGGPVIRRSYLFTVEPLGPPLAPDRPVALTRRVGGLTIGLRVPSDRVAHQMYAMTVSAGGRPVGRARIALTGRALDMDMGETEATARAVGPGRYVAALDVVMVGRWQVTATIRYGRSIAHVVFVYEAHY